MTNHAPFDDHIKKKLANYEPDVPAHVWENILAQKDKKRPAGFWLFFQKHGMKMFWLMLLTAGGFLVRDLLNGNPSNKPAKETAVSKTSIKHTGNEQTNNPAVKNEQPSIAGNTAPENNISNRETVHPDQNNNSHEPAGVHASKPAYTITDAVTAGGPVAENTAAPANKLNTMAATGSGLHTGDVFKPGTKQKRKTNTRSAAFSMPGETGNADNDVISMVDKNESTGQIQLLEPVSLQLQLLLNDKTFRPSVKGTNLLSLNIPCPEKERNAAGNKRYIELYGGPDYALRSFRDTANSVYMQKRKESTRFSSAFSAGLRYTRVFANGMSFRTGINYSQVNEKFKFVQGNIIQVVYITDAGGDTTGSYTTTSTRYKTTYNKFRTIDVPVLIGYEMGNEKIHTNINAGVVINAYSWFEGDVLDKTLQPVNISTGGSSSPYQYKTNIGLGFLGAVSFYYKINQRLHVLAEPYFRFNFSPASRSELTFKQKYSTTGLRLGVRYDF